MTHPSNAWFSSARFVILVCVLSVCGLAACSSPSSSTNGTPASSPNPEQPAPKRFLLQGRVVSIDKDQKKVTVEHGDIPGFMGAMTMAYPVKNPQLLDSLKPEDQITADVMDSNTEVWLENIVVRKDLPAKPAASEPSSPAPAKK
jgi:Cu/Ag efflux protein CusF